jgi:SAM-dependent methyltransferase
MSNESFKPISVKAPSANPLMFRIRCMVDLQLKTIVRSLRPAMAELRGKVLDVGAGESPWREWLPKGASYQGIDVGNANEFGMQAGREGVTYFDGHTIPFPDNSFDGAICIEVLEHVQDPQELLTETARCLRTGGLLLLTVPWSARRHHVPFDYHRFTRERLQELLASAGFTDIIITERGTDIDAIASKLVVLSMRLAPKGLSLKAVLALPLFLMAAPITAAFLLCAHLSGSLGLGAPEDPLGYFVRAVRQ